MDAVEVVVNDSEAQEELVVCRVCLGHGHAMRGLFHEEESQGDVGIVGSAAEKAMSLASVKMMPGDGLPSYICCVCSANLESAYKFKLQVEQADNVLRERLKSLDVKPELFFNDLDVNLTSHRNNVGEISEESLLLKDHMDLLNVQKINASDLYGENIEKSTNAIIDQQVIESKNDIQENQQLIQHEEQLQMQGEQEMQKIHNDHQIQIHDGQEMHDITNEQHNQSFGAELQEMIQDLNNQEALQELHHSQQLTMHEHNYVAESQPCDDPTGRDIINIEEREENDKIEIKEDSKEDIQTNLIDDQIEIIGMQTSSPNDSLRRSKRKLNQQKSQNERDSDQENYFENLNLSSRLKKTQSDTLEKIYFVCYLCDKQFISKDVLKEHMHSHEEVRKTLSLMKRSPEKLLKTPEKSQNETTSPRTPSSGKKLNTCPHCGKEYLYIISYNKHLKQHEKEKLMDIKVEGMPLEISFQEEDDTLDFHAYDDNPAMDSDVEEDEEKYKSDAKNKSVLKCNVCDEEFDAVDKLRNHRSKHVVEGVLTKQDLNDDVEKIAADAECESVTAEAPLAESSFKKDTSIIPNKELKCPQCSMTFNHKKALVRHTETHNSAQYTCKVCHQTFARKELLRRHAEQHGSRLKSFKCTQCNKTFGNELTLRNHLIATNHRTTVHGQEYDPNKRIKRVAAKAAQKIIDQIKTDFCLDESEDEDAEKDREFDDSKEELSAVDEEQAEYVPPIPKKLQRSQRSLTCETCNVKCSSKQALTKHMELHVKDENQVKQEKPQQQQKKLEETRETEERNEEEQHEDDDDDFESGLDWPMDSHECPTCKKKYSTKKSLLRHQLLHEEPNFECDICNVKFYRKDKLKAHYDKCSEKNPDQVRKCNICGDSFENNEILKEHRAKHVMEGILTEEDLRDIDPRPEDKNGDKAPRKRRTDIVGLECTECNKRYTSRKGLLRHIQVHEGKKYLCDICPKKFYRREHLKIHVAKHNMVKPYKCPRCTKRFIREDQLNTHLTKHDKTFKKAKETDTVKRFLCEICSKSFTQSTTLIAHLRAHNGIKPYVCEVCSRPFTTNAYLKMHMRTHTQERPYICQYCSRAFARADTLANHLTSHTGEAKYHCKYCPKNFRRLKSLKEHVFIHTGQRPYACPTCDRRFNNNGSRYAHSKRCKQNMLQGRQQNQQQQQVFPIEQELQEQQELHEQEQEDQQQDVQQVQQLQLQEQHDLQRLQQAQIIKPQSIKTITIRPDGTAIGQQHVMAHQEILMPLILPLTVTLTDVGEEVILPEGTKIFTT